MCEFMYVRVERDVCLLIFVCLLDVCFFEEEIVGRMWYGCVWRLIKSKVENRYEGDFWDERSYFFKWGDVLVLFLL